MLAYNNGEYPLSLFIHRGGNLYFTPSLNARWNEMVRLGVEKYGVRLWVTGDVDGLGGWNGYRPLLPQRRYKAYYCSLGRCWQAADPGKSSHGGKYQGKEVFALDIANVNALAPGNTSLAHARLTALAKAVGLRVNFVTPTEWWHVGDFNNAWSAPSFGHVAINPETTNKPKPVALEEEDEEMKGAYYTRSSDKRVVYMLFNDNSGFCHKWIVSNPDDNNAIATKWDTGAWVSLAEATAVALEKSLADTRQGK